MTTPGDGYDYTVSRLDLDAMQAEWRAMRRQNRRPWHLVRRAVVARWIETDRDRRQATLYARLRARGLA
jgi:hypothetical protein